MDIDKENLIMKQQDSDLSFNIQYQMSHCTIVSVILENRHLLQLRDSEYAREHRSMNVACFQGNFKITLVSDCMTCSS